MSFARFLRSQLLADGLNVRRDPMLKYFVVIPLFLALLVRFFVPPIAKAIDSPSFSAENFQILIMSYFFVLLTPMLFGVIIGFLLLDEKDELTLLALQVTPLGPGRYVLIKLIVPTVLSFFFTLIVFPIANLPGLTVELGPLILMALASSIWAPIMALTMPSLANNKVEGFALMKGLGAIFIIPVVAYFVNEPWQYLFGIIPTYFPAKAFWAVQAGEPFIIYIVLGLVLGSIPLLFFYRRFNNKVFS